MRLCIHIWWNSPILYSYLVQNRNSFNTYLEVTDLHIFFVYKWMKLNMGRVQSRAEKNKILHCIFLLAFQEYPPTPRKSPVGQVNQISIYLYLSMNCSWISNIKFSLILKRFYSKNNFNTIKLPISSAHVILF